MNEKLDHQALLAPNFSLVESGQRPRTPQEQVVCALYAEVLDLAGVSVDDSFFALGGNSLLAAGLIGRVRATFGVGLDLRTLFEAPTPAGLAARLGEGTPVRLPLAHYKRQDLLPLSFAQRRMWFLHQMEGSSATCNIPLALRLSGVLNREALQAALGDVVARHESLRTIFPQVRGVPYQHILDISQACPPLVINQVGQVELSEALATAARHEFDLTTAIPVRAELFVLAPDEQVLLLVVHHIAADAWSMRPLSADLATAYTMRCRGNAPNWAPLPIQYADYTLWQRQLLGDKADLNSLFAAQFAYWTQALTGLPNPLTLPTDRPRPTIASYRANYLTVRLDPWLHKALCELACHAGASLFMVLHAGLAALLSRLGAGEDIPVCSPIAGRTDPALDDLVGYFVNILVLRTDTADNPTFTQLLTRVRKAALSAYAHQDIPFECLIEVVNPAHSLAHHPLTQVMLNLPNTPKAHFHLPGLQLTAVQPLTGMPVDAFQPLAETAKADAFQPGVTKFDLSLHLSERHDPNGTPEGMIGLIEYASDLFDAASIRTILTQWMRLLEAVVADPDQPMGRIQ